MTPKERFICALNLGTPDRVPTFELEFQLAPELMGKDFLREEELTGLSENEIDRKLYDNAEYLVKVYTHLEHDAICLHYLNDDHLMKTARIIKEITNDRFMLLTHGDGTFAIPDGNGMEELAYKIADDPEAVDKQAEEMCIRAIERNRRLLKGGFDGFILCSDYCFNMGPFMSPKMFARFITPYLKRIIEDIRVHGGYTIKHTDGNIMPILDQLISANPHALHSIDPMAGVDIREVKRITQGKVALCGNVHCAHMQTGTEQDVIDSCEYCLTHAKSGGGYIFATSNIPFKGLPLERYQLVLDIWKKYRNYE